MYPESEVSGRSGIIVVQEHQVMKRIGQHGQGVQNRKRPDKNLEIPVPDYFQAGEVKDEPGDTEGNYTYKSYPQGIYVREKTLRGNNGNRVQEGPESYKNPQHKKTFGLTVSCISKP